MSGETSIGRSALRVAGLALCAAAASWALFRWAPAAAGLEARLGDRLRLATGPAEAAQDPRVSIVAIDEATLASLPYRSPVDRALLARIVEALGAAGAAAVGFDVLFDQPTEPEKDAALAAALAAFPGTKVIAWADARAGMTEAQSAWLAQFLAATGARPGFANLRTDPDGLVRRHFSVLEGAEIPGFSAALTGRAAPGESAVWRIDWRPPGPGGGPAFQTTPAHVIPLLVAQPQILKTWFAGRIVLIGATLPQQDRHPTPMAPGGVGMPGVEIHAQLVAQLLEGRVSPEPAPGVAAAAILAAALAACALALAPMRGWVRAPLLAALVPGWGGLAALALAQGVALPLAPPALAMALGAGAAMGLDAAAAHRRRKWVREAFSRYLAPQLVDHLVRNPGALRLGGERRRMTFLFTDIAGFTGMSERMAPEELGALLNAYLDGVAAIVMRRRGVIDKYIGDAVVALFGVPADDPAHAARALDCAAEIDRFAESFRAQHAAAGLGITRIGLHTGEAVVGNFGGALRFDYTAIGDAMNTAARLEGANKAFGTRVCFSGACLAAALPHLADAPPVQAVGEVMLKGKTEPLPVFALRADRDAAWRAAWAEAYAALGAGAPEAAARLAAMGEDPVARLHMDRLAKGETGTMFVLTEK